ncbi:Z protein [Dhati Welel virus]|uniref:Z protein n=1 Tax=Dhati Welel virus TaxID=3070833 RepID=A0ACD0Z5L2_9VIRU|nr:Z protein [Dhati Welel mammarenavirus]QLJ57223.1 Z protein [Dhati Welel mammarenavirus]
MGQRQGKSSKSAKNTEDSRARATLTPDATGFGPEFCKSCWFERRGLVKCSDHYLCMSCLTLLLSVSDRCPICKFPLPTRLRLDKQPSAPEDQHPPPYSP